LVAVQPIKKGQVIKAEDIAVKRPGGGRSPYDYWKIIGQQSRYDYQAGDLLLD
ncbi:MAG: N-acetylneuraminate synthase, partial [Leeuwenhoekiella sp.]